MMDQTGKPESHILITGAAGGLGKAFAVECAGRGWPLFLTDQNGPALETLAGGLRAAYGVPVRIRPCNLADSESRAAFLEGVACEGLRFRMLINVAGTDTEGSFHAISRRAMQTILRVNIEATLDLTHSLLALRDPLAPFRVVNVASLAAFYPMPVKAVYAASKRFLLDWSLALREEVRDLGATVTVLCPGGMYTNAECIAAIEAQGLAGHLTAQNVGSVAAETLDAALAGRAVFIPGVFNRALRLLGGVVPPAIVAGFIHQRWKAARGKRRETEAPATGPA
jgi:short-subunit dehydrogenase